MADRISESSLFRLISVAAIGSGLSPMEIIDSVNPTEPKTFKREFHDWAFKKRLELPFHVPNPNSKDGEQWQN